MDAGEPIDENDAGAQTHDWEYQVATSHEDVIRADEKFIDTVENTGTMFGMTAGAAIRAKMAVENQFGQIYPPQEYLDNNVAMALEATYPELPKAEPGENVDAKLLAWAIGVAFGWRTLMYGDADTETPADGTGDALDQQTQAMQLAAMAATVVWGKGLTELQGASQRLADTVGPPDAVSTDQIVNTGSQVQTRAPQEGLAGTEGLGEQLQVLHGEGNEAERWEHGKGGGRLP